MHATVGLRYFIHHGETDPNTMKGGTEFDHDVPEQGGGQEVNNGDSEYEAQNRLNKELEAVRAFYGPEKVDPGLEAFVTELHQNKAEILENFARLMEVPAENPDEFASKVYLRVTLPERLQGIDPYAVEDAETVEDAKRRRGTREYIAACAAEWVAHNWLREHPESQPARDIAKLTIWALPGSQYAFLREMWPSVLQRMRDIRSKTS